MRALRKFGRGFMRTAWSTDWFHWYLLGVYVVLGLVGGLVWTELEKAVKG